MISNHSVFILQIMVEDLLTSGKPEMRVFIDFYSAILCRKDLCKYVSFN